MQEMRQEELQILSLDQEDPPGKEMATHSSILAWKIPWTEEPGGYSPWDHKESDKTEQLNANAYITVTEKSFYPGPTWIHPLESTHSSLPQLPYPFSFCKDLGPKRDELDAP